MCRDARAIDPAGNETSLGTVRVRGRCDLDIYVHRVLLDVVVVSSRLSTGSSRLLPRVRPFAASKSQFGHKPTTECVGYRAPLWLEGVVRHFLHNSTKNAR